MVEGVHLAMIRRFFIGVIQTCYRCCQKKDEEELDVFIMMMAGARVRGQQRRRCFMVSSSSLHPMSQVSSTCDYTRSHISFVHHVSSIALTYFQHKGLPKCFWGLVGDIIMNVCLTGPCLSLSEDLGAPVISSHISYICSISP